MEAAPFQHPAPAAGRPLESYSPGPPVHSYGGQPPVIYPTQPGGPSFDEMFIPAGPDSRGGVTPSPVVSL